MSINCTGVILAGGLSSRMGSDKAELKRSGLSMLDFCQELLGEAGLTDILVSRNTGQGIKDEFEQCGPLGGIYSVVKTIKKGAALILPVDMPLLQVSDITELLEHGERTNRPVCFSDCYLPLYLPVNQPLINYLEHQLRHNGNRKVRALINEFDGEQISHHNDLSLINTNTPQQWQQSQLQISSRGHHGT